MQDEKEKNRSLEKILKEDYETELSEEDLSELADRLRKLVKLAISHRNRVLTSSEYYASRITRTKSEQNALEKCPGGQICAGQ